MIVEDAKTLTIKTLYIKALFATLIIKDTTYKNRLCIKAHDARFYLLLSVMVSECENFRCIWREKGRKSGESGRRIRHWERVGDSKEKRAGSRMEERVEENGRMGEWEKGRKDGRKRNRQSVRAGDSIEKSQRERLF